MIRCNVHIAQLFGLLFETYNDAWDTPAMPARKEMICSANIDLDHLGALLPSTALQLFLVGFGSHGISHYCVCSPPHTDCVSLDGSRSHSHLSSVAWKSWKRWKRWSSWPSWSTWGSLLPMSTNRPVLQLPS